MFFLECLPTLRLHLNCWVDVLFVVLVSYLPASFGADVWYQIGTAPYREGLGVRKLAVVWSMTNRSPHEINHCEELGFDAFATLSCYQGSFGDTSRPFLTSQVCSMLGYIYSRT